MRTTSLDNALVSLGEYSIPEISIDLATESMRALVTDYCHTITTQKDDLSKKDIQVLKHAGLGLTQIRSLCEDRDLHIKLIIAISEISYAMQMKNGTTLSSHRREIRPFV